MNTENNEYQWTTPVIKEAEGLFGKYKRGLLLYRILVIASGVFTVFLIVGEMFWRRGADTHTFSLFVFYLILAIGMVLGRSAGEYGRMLRAWKLSPRVLHDYCRLRYDGIRKDTGRSMLLFLMAKCNIYSGNLAQAAQELNRVDYYKIPQVNQAAYHLLWAIIDRFDGRREEFARNVDTYRQMILARGRQIPRGEVRLRTLLEGNDLQVRELVNIGEDLEASHESMVWNSVLCVLLSALVFVTVGSDLLPVGIIVPEGPALFVRVILQIMIFAAGCVGLVKKNRIRKLTGTGDGQQAAGIVVLILLTLLFLFSDFLGVFRLILMTPATEESVQSEEIAEDWGNEWDSSEGWQTWGRTVTDEDKQEMYEAIYRMQLSEFEGGLTLSSSGKGELYALVGDPYEIWYLDETVSAQMRLVYDRLSENGECYEVVCYQDRTSLDQSQSYDTGIYDIYAIVIDTGEVIPSGRKAWADVGNEAYRRATGE